MTPVMLTDGDILDRLSIIHLKKAHGLEEDTLPFDRWIANNPDYATSRDFVDLFGVNQLLWRTEDAIRIAHSEGDIGEIVRLSKQVITENARRAEIKRRIDGERAEKKKYAGQ